MDREKLRHALHNVLHVEYTKQEAKECRYCLSVADALMPVITDAVVEWLEVEASVHFGSLDNEILILTAAMFRREMSP